MEPDPSSGRPEVSLVASSSGESAAESYIGKAVWSADGTAIFTSAARDITSYVLPHDLLEPRDKPAALQPQGIIHTAEPNPLFAPCPYFSLSDPNTHSVLIASKDHPIQLHHAFPPTGNKGGEPAYSHPPPPLASYNFVQPERDKYYFTAALIWPSQPGTNFLVSSKNLIALFDVSRPGSEPVLRINVASGAFRGSYPRGMFSALAAAGPDPTATSQLVAVGTWTRHVGLFDLLRAGEAVAGWSLERTAAGLMDKGAPVGTGEDIGGHGVLQTLWSPCGRYLVVNERQSTGLLVYDVRATGKLLATLTGRDAKTYQRLECDVFSGSAESGGFELWAGARDGTVKVWDSVGSAEGVVGSSWDWTTGSSAVGSTALHSSGAVVATATGSWCLQEEIDDEEQGTPSPYGPRVKVVPGGLGIWSIRNSTLENTDRDGSAEA